MAPIYESVADFAAMLRSFESSGRRDVLARVYGRALETPLMARHHDPGTQNSEPRLPVRMLRTDEILTHDALESRVPQAVLGSIRKHGLLPPILVRQSEAGYELVAGRDGCRPQKQPT